MYNKSDIENCVEIVKSELRKSQYNEIFKKMMLPLCVPFADKDKVKSLGAVWCPKAKSWFISTDIDKHLVQQWLPAIYNTSKSVPYLTPRLVPEKLWYLNLRSILTKEEWNTLRRTYEEAGNKCSICGCKGEKWPVECDEEWRYEVDYESNKGMIYFDGLKSLCPGCHQVRHFGKARVDGNDNMALGRLAVINSWDVKVAREVVEKAFTEWEKMSKIEEWILDAEVFEKKYGITLTDSELLTRI